MSFGGTVQHMINSIKNNQIILNKHVPFSQLKEHINRRTEKKLKISDSKFSAEEIEKAKAQVIKEMRRTKKRNRFISILSLLIACVLVAGLFYWIVITPHNWDINYSTKEQAERSHQKKLQQLQKFNFYIEDGNRWLEKKNLGNAIFQYNLGIKIIPTDSTANVNLSKALLLKCLTTSEDCFLAKQQLLNTYQLLDRTTIKEEMLSFLIPFSDSSTVKELIYYP